MANAEFIEHVKGLGDIYRVYAPFNQQIQALNEKGIKTLISVRDASYARIHGKNKEYTRTCHAQICAKDSPVIIARISPLIKNLAMAEQAVNAHRNNQYPVFDDDKSIYAQWEKIAKQDKDKNPSKMRAIILSEREDYIIHRDSDEAKFFFQDTRKPYFKQFVSKDSIPVCQIPIEGVDSQNGTIINYAGFNSPEIESNLDFRGRGLDGGRRALGVLRRSAEGTSRKISKTKELDEIVQTALKQKKAFEYNGILYVPVRGKSVSLKQ